MSKLTILEASKQFNINRARIYRAIESGKITAIVDNDGTKSVDVADMVRVFNGKPNKHTNTTQTEHTVQNEHQPNSTELLQEQLKFAKEQVDFYKAQAQEIRKDFDDFKALALLNAPKQTEQDRTEENEATSTERTRPEHSEQTEKKPIFIALLISFLVILVIALVTILFFKYQY